MVRAKVVRISGIFRILPILRGIMPFPCQIPGRCSRATVFSSLLPRGL